MGKEFQIVYSPVHAEVYRDRVQLDRRLAELKEQTGMDWQALPDHENRLIFKPKQNGQTGDNKQS